MSAQHDLTAPPIALDQQLIDEVVMSVKTVFTSFGIAAECKSSKIGADRVTSGDVSGVVGIVQDQTDGNLILSFTRAVIFDILSRVYARDFDKIDGIVQQ